MGSSEPGSWASLWPATWSRLAIEVVVYNRSQSAIDELTAESDAVTAAGSPAEVGRAADTVIPMLPDSPDVRDVVFGENGVLNGVREGFLLIDMSTIAPSTAIEVSTRVATAGGAALDAPVSGGDKGAIAGTLSIMVGGSEADLAAGDAALRGDGQDDRPRRRTRRRPDRQGLQPGHGRGQLRGRQRGAGAGRTAGVDPEKVAQVLGGGLAASRVLEMRGATMIKGDFQPGFRVDLHRKDLAIALATGRERQSALPITALVSQLYDALSATGGGQLDHSALITVIERMSGE